MALIPILDEDRWRGEKDWTTVVARLAKRGSLLWPKALPASYSCQNKLIIHDHQYSHTTDVCGSKLSRFLMQTGSTNGGKLQSICQENSREIYFTHLSL
ncbi:hypothetical protein V6N11_034103 [Hibiscus sabdariffa]|uniref:Uncharacterized protein n=1 Tax=Hibiscus sabdariffa TaxID=183260 RepID=A0ABR2S1M3_9ROSI